ncbi:FkbM family methyltransferase [Nostoc commune]|nr:FkbM family methyltransferase [Nostoc commune]
MNKLYDTPKCKDLIYDIGMHKGEDSIFYLQKGFRVTAFEADPDLARLCRNRLKEYIDRGEVTIVEGAITNLDSIETGQKVQFYKNLDDSVWGTICVDWAERNTRLCTSSKLLEVNVIDFVSILQQHGIPYYMKIDIEGVDMVCVNVLKLFRERPDYISIESSKTRFTNIKREIDALVELGYDSFQAVEQSSIPYSQSPPYPAKEGSYVDQAFEFGSSGLFGSEIGGRWKSKREILRQYRVIFLAYYLIGDDGIMNQWKFRGSSTIRALTNSFLKLLTKTTVPGWYDTHARHSSVDAGKV